MPQHFLVLFALSSFVAFAVADPLTVDTKFGKVIGVNEGGKARAFLGVPFALPPVGERRFAPPESWVDPYGPDGYDATHFKPACVQNLGQGIFKTSEDCLYLNIYTPLDATPTSALPVMVYLFGGSFTNGAGSVIAYNGTHLAQHQRAVVVTINYRVGAFGFGVFQDSGKVAANFGLQDQREALKWVQTAIRAYGGDPGKVMLFGESAGACSTQIHLVLPKSKGLFQTALSESGLLTAYPLQHSLDLTKTLGNLLGCPSGHRTCLLHPTASDILAAEAKMKISEAHVMTHSVFSPTYGDDEMPEHPAVMASKGFPSTDVTLVAGVNTNESNLFVYGDNPLGMTAKAYEKFIHDFLSANGLPAPPAMMHQILKEYPAKTIGDNRYMCSLMTTDATFLTGTWFLADVYSAAQAKANSTAGTYLYRFNHVPSVPIPLFGVYHMTEIPFVWHVGIPKAYSDFSNAVGGYWVRAAATKDPNGAGAHVWPKYSPDTRINIVLDDPISIEANYRQEAIAFWRSFPPYPNMNH